MSANDAVKERKKAPEVLLVSDDLDSRMKLKSLLLNAKIKTQEAESVSRALWFVERRLPHLVLVDLAMKARGGFEYLERHHKNPVLERVPVVVIAQDKDKTEYLQAMGIGASDYILRPLDHISVLLKVRKG